MDGGTVQVFPSLAMCSGYSTIEMVGGGPSFFSFFSLLSAFLAGSCPW